MKLPTLPRVVIAAIILLVLTGILAMAINAFDVLLSMWERLHATSPWLAMLYAVFLLLFALAGVVLILWLVFPRKQQADSSQSKQVNEPEIRRKIPEYTEKGVDTEGASNELETLDQRRRSGEIYVALYGEISSGKSSLIAALIPGIDIAIDVRGGTTDAVRHYRWQSTTGDRIVLADVPGLNEVSNPAAQQAAQEEALRAHIVVYVCDGDLTRDQWSEIQRLQEFNKPLIVALNKADRYTETALQSIRNRMLQRFDVTKPVEIVLVQAGGEEEVIRVTADGREETVVRPRMAKTDSLIDALQKQMSLQGTELNTLRDTAIFRLAAGKLDQAVSEYRRQNASQLVEKYTRRAVIGALAAITPGSDLVIQGALATKFVKDACALYEVPVRQVEIEELLKSATQRFKGSSALILAISGNAFKAFPGVGTITGGLMHAVAYGLLFDTLGRALVTTLHTRGELATEPTLMILESTLSEDLAARAGRLAKIALEERGKQDH